MVDHLIIAENKTNAATEVVKSLLILNSLRLENEQESYSIFLDYRKKCDGYKFSIDIQKNYSNVEDSMISVNFNLESLEEGMNLLNKVRDSFKSNSSSISTSFHKKIGFDYPYDCYDLVDKNNINLHFRIRSLEHCQELQEYDNSLYQNSAIDCKVQKKSIPIG